MFKLFISYLLLINALGVLLMYVDQSRARKKMRRISEVNLFSVALIGGSMGILFAMLTMRHKTRHSKFTIGIPFILALQVLSALFLLFF